MGVHWHLIAVFLLVVSAISLFGAETKKTGHRKQNRLNTKISPSGKDKSDQGSSFRPNTSSGIMEKLMVDYIKQEPPMTDRPTEVKLGIYINSFYSVSEQTMDYSVNMYLRQNWRDPRLTFTPPAPKQVHKIRLGEKYYSGTGSIWVPDTFFRNEKKAQFHSVTVDNKMMNLESSGEIWYVSKISATLSCPMTLHKYPFDTQVCPMMFESFGYTMDTLFFAWIDIPVAMDPSVLLPQFHFVESHLYDCSQNYTAGAFPCQEIRFVLQRDIGYFVIQVFVPSILIVILSWVSFWINIDGVPARVSIGLLTVLTTTTQSSGINQTLPRVSYIKAIDIWMIMCLLFVFAALLEYAVVNVAARNGVRIRTPIVRQATLQPLDGDRRNDLDHRSSHSESCFCWKACTSSGEGPAYSLSVDVEGSKRRARQVDKISRKCFPLAFILFNIVYWMAYTLPASVTSSSSSEDPAL